MPSITGDNFDEGNDFGLGTTNASLAETLVRVGNPHTKYVNLTGHGYLLLDLDASRAQGEFWHMADIHDPGNATETMVAAYAAQDGQNRMTTAGAASAPIMGMPPPPARPCRPVGVEGQAATQVLSLYPNPTSHKSWMHLVQTRHGHTDVIILDAAGRQVQQVWSGDIAPGHYLLELNLEGLSPGALRVVVRNAQGGVQALPLLLLR